jgi:hypothetical protein
MHFCLVVRNRGGRQALPNPMRAQDSRASSMRPFGGAVSHVPSFWQNKFEFGNENNGAANHRVKETASQEFPGAFAGTKKANGVSKDSTPGNGEGRAMIRDVFAAIQEEKP